MSELTLTGRNGQLCVRNAQSGVYPRDPEPAEDDDPKAITPEVLIVGRSGLVYICERRWDDLELVVSLYKATHHGRGPLVSRRQGDLRDLVLERWPVDGEGRRRKLVDAAPDDRDPDAPHEWTDYITSVVAKWTTAVVFEMAESVGVPPDGSGTRRTSLGDERPGPSVRAAVDEAWIDDDYSPTVAELRDRIRARTGVDFPERSIKSAMSRGPFRSDRGRPARWTRIAIRAK